MNIIHLTETDSTNRYLMDHADEYADNSITVAVADYQTAGKGMGTNTWESAPGQNLLYSILIHPIAIAPREQYLLSMVQALAVRDAIEYAVGTASQVTPEVKDAAGNTPLLPSQGADHPFVTIKWPNDIYCGDNKISGTLIDLRLTGGKMRHIVIGTGININQKAFLSDAPNPISIYQLTGREHSLNDVLTDVMQRFARYYDTLLNGGKDEIIGLYHSHLYRRTDFHLYEDADGCFEAELTGVATDGIMTLKRRDGTLSQYEFKQVRFVM